MKKINLSKKFLGLFLAVFITISLTGCNNKNTETAEDKVKVGLSWAYDEIDEDIQMYADAVEKAGGEPVFLPQFQNEEEVKEALKDINAVILTGGDDINPALYNESAHEKLEDINIPRDVSDIALLNVCIEEDMPTIGTCRGMQLTNIICGGSLYQDIPSQNPSEIVHRDPAREIFVKHKITLDKGNLISEAIGRDGEFEVNSWHHQAIKELGENLEVVALAEDETIEAVIKTDNSYFIGFQWHPEELINNDDEDSLNIYKAFVNKANERANNK